MQLPRQDLLSPRESWDIALCDANPFLWWRLMSVKCLMRRHGTGSFPLENPGRLSGESGASSNVAPLFHPGILFPAFHGFHLPCDHDPPDCDDNGEVDLDDYPGERNEELPVLTCVWARGGYRKVRRGKQYDPASSSPSPDCISLPAASSSPSTTSFSSWSSSPSKDWNTEYYFQENVAGVKSTILCLQWTWTVNRTQTVSQLQCLLVVSGIWTGSSNADDDTLTFEPFGSLWKPILSIPGRHRRLKWASVPLTKHFRSTHQTTDLVATHNILGLA